ncbi:4'-phosphopantetheinyl transferase superfamily [Aspergillus crustosus]
MESMKVLELKATLLISFGFGQKGALAIIVSPRYLFASVSANTYQDYQTQVSKRQSSAIPTFVLRIMNNNIVQVKAQPPWRGPEAIRAYIQGDNASNPVSQTIQAMLEILNSAPLPATSIGVDVEVTTNINIHKDTFISRNFTLSEREYCSQAPDPRASFAGRWSVKEAVFKSLQTTSAGPGAAMTEIEIINDDGIHRVVLHGHAQEITTANGIVNIEVSINHCNNTAIAVALAKKESTH